MSVGRRIVLGMKFLRSLAELVRLLPVFVAWRMAKWVRDVHESRYIDGPISDELVKAQYEEFRLRMWLRSGREPIEDDGYLYVFDRPTDVHKFNVA